MNRRGSHFTKADMKRMLEAARDAGFEVAAFEMKPDGTIRIEQNVRDLDGNEANDSLKSLILREAKSYET
ncbi:MAG: hypothetical protein WCO61_05940 [Alphaproteobacteria bacterium]